jgi:hypothetical protein
VNHLAPPSADYDFWIKNDLNVLFIGKHGIGKTESVKEKFKEHFGDRWMYMSASTMDPWVDFIGVPKEVKDDTTGETYLELVRPKRLQNDEVEAIMIDEYNRAPAKVRNAIMELIQFRSINGKKFNNLKVIWAAINPDDDESYDVERLDPAQRDRFPIQVHLPYDVNLEFFQKRYGAQGEIACAWWRNLEDDLKNEISPRRLSYVLDVFNLGGGLSYVLPEQANLHELVTQLTEGSYTERMKDLFLSGSDEEITEAFSNENFFNGTEKAVAKNKDYIKRFVPHFPKERLLLFYLSSIDVRNHFTTDETYIKYQSIFDPILAMEGKLDAQGKKITPMFRGKEIEYSIFTALTRWKVKSIPDGAISDMEYVNMVSNTARNITYLSKPEQRNAMINRFGTILNGELRHEPLIYTKMFGVLCELTVRVKDDPKVFAAVLKCLEMLKVKMFTYGMESFEQLFNPSLSSHGFRRGTANTTFTETQDILVANGILREVTA